MANPVPDFPPRKGGENRPERPVDESARSEPSEDQVVAWLDQLWQTEGTASGEKDAEANLVPFQIGPFDVRHAVGHGAFGVVYRAVDRRLGRDVALKIPRPEVMLCYDKLQRFEGEAQAAARLDHPGIVPIYAADLSGPTPYIASAFCSGPDLARWLEQHSSPRRDCQTVARFLLDVARAVAYAHSQGVVHRDIKPSNLMLIRHADAADDGSLASYAPRLTDFGLAKITDAPLTNSRSSWILGTPTYMAPEQLLPQWGPPGQRSDIFALGALLYELLEGQPPRFGQTYADIIAGLLDENSPVPEFRRTDVPADLKVIVSRCLAKDPAERYGSAEALAADLEAVVEGRPIAARRFTWVDAFLRWARQPQRPVQICFFVIPLNIVMSLWMMVCALVASGPLFPGGDRAAMIAEAMVIGLGPPSLVIGMCLLRLRGHRWAPAIACLVTFGVTVVVPTLSLLGVMDTFADIYRDAPYFDLTNHALVLMFGFVGSFLLGVSVYADLHQVRRDRAVQRRSLPGEATNSAGT